MTRKDFNLKRLQFTVIRWLKLLKDYELVFNYHPRKANVVVDILSQKYLFAFRPMNKSLNLERNGSLLAELRVKLMFSERIRDLQINDSDLLMKLKLVDSR